MGGGGRGIGFMGGMFREIRGRRKRVVVLKRRSRRMVGKGKGYNKRVQRLSMQITTLMARSVARCRKMGWGYMYSALSLSLLLLYQQNQPK